MSFRTLVELNHDQWTAMTDPEMLVWLKRYLASADRGTAEHLERFGIRVIGMRHHADNFILDGTPDGFPPQYLPRAKAKP